MSDSRFSDNDVSSRDIPSFIEPRPPLISNPFMRPRPQKGTNLLEQFDEESEYEQSELVQVYLRLKPCNKNSNLYEVRSERSLITSLDTTTAGHGRRTQHNVSKMYTFSHIFGPDSSQREIFEHVVKDNLKRLPEGNSFTLLTYGASGSGKTFTLMGTVASPGLVPRSLEYVFKVVEAAQTPLFKPSETGADKLSYAEQDYELQCLKRFKQVAAPLRDKYRRMSAQLFSDLTSSNLDLSNRTRHYVWVSFIEIYNEGIYDLLAPGDRRHASKLAIREDSSGNVYVKGAIQAFVRSGEEAYDIMVAGKHNLQVAATGIHAQSSRSHCIFTITMLTETSDGVRGACVRLCDLAGCERAARTRNTGARMHESRAINSSLHVLERCLRTLRRKRSALVPYRESKLTRLLGAGLSGTRGEAVSMVVTLNPSPEFVHETRHVLQLATVAKDIPINNTISEYPSTLETSAQDSTITSSAEVMKLRAENERLHFELVQAQARNRDLSASIEQRQADAADTVRELVEEAKDISRQYYEEQMQALRDQMEEMAEEYEIKLKDTASITQLMKELVILEENLTAERLARERAEAEVQHLRACIEERDAKTDEDNESNEDVVSVTESDDSEDEDSCNESLEPTFKKEDINRTRLQRQCAINDLSLISEPLDNSIQDKTSDTLKDDQINESIDNNCSYKTGEDLSLNQTEYNSGSSVERETKTSRDTFVVHNRVIESVSDAPNKISSTSRDTYCITNAMNDSEIQDLQKTLNCDKNDVSKTSLLETELRDQVELEKGPQIFVNKIISTLKKSVECDNSLDQFERLEIATKTIKTEKQNATEEFCNIKMLKETRNYFDEESTRKSPETPSTVIKCKEKKIYFDNIDVVKSNKKQIEVGLNMQIDEFRSPSIVKEDVTKDFEPTIIKKLLGTATRQADIISSINKKLAKKCDSIDIFDSPQVANKAKDLENVESTQKSDENNTINDDIRITKNVIDSNAESKLEIRSNKEIVECDPNLKNCAIQEDTFPIKTQTERKSFDNKIIETDYKKMKIVTEKELEILSTKPSTDFDKTDVNTDEISTIKKDIIESNDEEANKNSNVHAKNANINVEFIVKDNKFETQNHEQTTHLKGDEPQLQMNNTNVNNTIEEFENIYKDITVPRATEFDLLTTQEIPDCTIDTNKDQSEIDELKYNLRRRANPDKSKTEIKAKNKSMDEENVTQKVFKCETESKPKRRNLRLRRHKNLFEESSDLNEENKLKDIVNLKVEFSDVTMGIPAQVKPSKDIPSPEKLTDNENQPPMLDIHSCPSKSVTRSRRKLFTPRIEPLDESTGQTGDSNERVYVPRPSYHRPRARRKL